MRGWVWVILDGEMASQAATLTRPARPASKESGPLAAAFVDTAYWLWMDVKSQQQLLPSRRYSKGLLLALYIISLSLFSSFRRCPAVDVWRINRMESTPPVNSLDTPFSHRVSTHTCIPLPPQLSSSSMLHKRLREAYFAVFSAALHCTAAAAAAALVSLVLYKDEGPFIANSQRGRRDTYIELGLFGGRWGGGTSASNCSMMTLLHGRLTQSEYYAVQQSRMLLQTKKEKKRIDRPVESWTIWVWRLTSCYKRRTYWTAYIKVAKGRLKNKTKKKSEYEIR